MARKVDPNKMSRAELEEYVNNLPEERPPKMSNAGWLAGFGILILITFFLKLNAGDTSAITWIMLAGGIASLIGAGYIAYKVSTYHRD